MKKNNKKRNIMSKLNSILESNKVHLNQLEEKQVKLNPLKKINTMDIMLKCTRKANNKYNSINYNFN